MNPLQLEKLSDAELLALLHRVYRRSRKCNGDLVSVLVAVSERSLHLKGAQPSVFEFCVKVLGMSNASAQRYAVAARLAKQIPGLIERIKRGEIHLTTLLLLRHHLTPQNADELLELARGRTRYQVDELLASIAPRPDAPSRMRKLPTPRTNPSVAPLKRAVEPLAPERYRVQFNADRDTHDDILQARDLMMHSNPSGDLDRVMKFCVRAGVERLEARQQGLLRQRPPRTADRPRPVKSRHIPRAIRRAVFERDGAQCTFHDENGNRCCAKTLLELDHVDLYALGGQHTLENLRVRCRAHNRFHAEQVLGKAFIEKRIASRHANETRETTGATGHHAQVTATAANDSMRSADGTKRSKPIGSNHANGGNSAHVAANRGEKHPRGASTAERRVPKPLRKAKEPRVRGTRGSSGGADAAVC
jgi:5-methylcytosine-specific restriction endonuclease McrA